MFTLNLDTIPFVIAATLSTVLFIFFMVVFLITFKNRQNRKSKEALRAIINERERTMQLISIELYDNISNLLHLARININTMEDEDEAVDMKMLGKIGDIIDTVIMDTHHLGHGLNSKYIGKNGLVNALKEEIEWVNNSKKIACTLHVEGITDILEDDVEIMLFRIAQEAIQNSIKYARANEISIFLRYGTHDFAMSLSDNGIGFDVEQADFKPGLGITSMHDRAKNINGLLTIHSRTGKGTRIEVVLKEL
ncbi:hypothetical protein DBR32_15425 [Taibaiella sp. KBW10]|uniref:sensor histidine kinase n=1 Tax=Taibaiella sp. KBW10 TaxID=2153357 RepID=UPI000F5A9D89|nr:ATP-binding protein [Taibaiella sp. KBW10]RQO29647.1 hypothetical protein DBR32_15425 [Taibaiella sp. KBW10]